MDRSHSLDLDTVSFVTLNLILALGLYLDTNLLDLNNYQNAAEFYQYFEEIRQFLPSLANRVAVKDALTQLFVTLLEACKNTFGTDEIYAQSLLIFT